MRSSISTTLAVLWLCVPLGLSAEEPSGSSRAGVEAELQRAKQLVQSYYQRVWNEGDLSAIDDIFASEYDREGLKDTVSLFQWGFPESSMKVVGLIGEGDRVVAHWVAEARHEGKIFGIEPTGAWVTVKGIEIFQIEDGRVVQDWQVWDRFGLLQQLQEASDPSAHP